MKQSDIYHLVSEKDLRRLDRAIGNLMDLATTIFGPEHRRLRVRRRRLNNHHPWWLDREPPIQPKINLLDVF